MKDLTGKTFQHGYRLNRLVGEGAMGQVYEAQSSSLGTVALKVLSPELTAEPRFVERFNVEVASLRGLKHEHIVPALDHFIEDRYCCIVMKYIDGGSLADRLSAKGRLPIPEALAIMDGVLSALDHAHSSGIIHRDVKPSNILMDRQRGPMLCDFGIARKMGAGRITRYGRSVGTAEYMSPEQIRGIEEPRHLIDVYASGVLLYEMVTGRVPFQGASDADVHQQHIHDEPIDPSRLNPAVGSGLSYAILKAMRKDPKRRFHGCEQFRAQLQGLPRPAGSGSAPPEPAPSQFHQPSQPAPTPPGPQQPRVPFRVYERPDLRVVAVRKGFSKPALLGNFVWMMNYGLYGRAALLLFVYAVLLVAWSAGSGVVSLLAGAGFVVALIVPGWMGNGWIEAELKRVGFVQRYQVEAVDERDAIEKTLGQG